MQNSNVAVLEKFYSDFSRGDYKAALALCDDAFTFQVPGKSRLAGKYSKANFAQDFAGQLKELSGGTFQLNVHDILASDQHGTVLLSYRLEREGKTVELRGVHVWRMGQGKPLAGYDYPRDLYQYDTTWS